MKADEQIFDDTTTERLREDAVKLGGTIRSDEDIIKGIREFIPDAEIHEIRASVLALTNVPPPPEKILGLQPSISELCVQCGECCKLNDPIAWTRSEAKRMAKHLGMKWSKFKRKYSGELFKEDAMKFYNMRADPCPFLDGCRCSEYEYRPESCKNFPLGPILKMTLGVGDGLPGYCTAVFKLVSFIQSMFIHDLRLMVHPGSLVPLSTSDMVNLSKRIMVEAEKQ